MCYEWKEKDSIYETIGAEIFVDFNEKIDNAYF